MASSMGGSPPGSPLSSVPSEEDPFDGEQDHDHDQEEEIMPPSKRQKTGYNSMRATPIPPIVVEDEGYISPDTDGEMPEVEPNSRMDDDDTHEQVTFCAWSGCAAGDLKNMDRLVEHIHAEHIETRQKKYTCEWSDCSRKSHPHASGYALKAHMRSHTKEKPFYCALPECDRAFTRSDALAKHMRTVHETEALRPSDPIPKNLMGKQPKPIIKTPQPDETPPPTNGNSNGQQLPEWTTSYPPELGFTSEEEATRPDRLCTLLRRKLQWTIEDSVGLKKELEELEELHKLEWMEKEILFHQASKADQEYQETRKKILSGHLAISDSVIKAAVGADTEQKELNLPIPDDSAVSEGLPSFQSVDGNDTEAAAVLASLHQG